MFLQICSLVTIFLFFQFKVFHFIFSPYALTRSPNTMFNTREQKAEQKVALCPVSGESPRFPVQQCQVEQFYKCRLYRWRAVLLHWFTETFNMKGHWCLLNTLAVLGIEHSQCHQYTASVSFYCIDRNIFFLQLFI